MSDRWNIQVSDLKNNVWFSLRFVGGHDRLVISEIEDFVENNAQITDAQAMADAIHSRFSTPGYDLPKGELWELGIADGILEIRIGEGLKPWSYNTLIWTCRLSRPRELADLQDA